MSSLILSEAQSFHTLEGALKWAFARSPRGELAGVVAQDEFTHDVVVRIAADIFLVFDTT